MDRDECIMLKDQILIDLMRIWKFFNGFFLYINWIELMCHFFLTNLRFGKTVAFLMFIIKHYKDIYFVKVRYPAPVYSTGRPYTNPQYMPNSSGSSYHPSPSQQHHFNHSINPSVSSYQGYPHTASPSIRYAHPNNSGPYNPSR